MKTKFFGVAGGRVQFEDCLFDGLESPEVCQNLTQKSEKDIGNCDCPGWLGVIVLLLMTMLSRLMRFTQMPRFAELLLAVTPPLLSLLGEKGIITQNDKDHDFNEDYELGHGENDVDHDMMRRQEV